MTQMSANTVWILSVSPEFSGATEIITREVFPALRVVRATRQTIFISYEEQCFLE